MRPRFLPLLVACVAGALAVREASPGMASTGDHWLWPGPPNAFIGMPAFLDSQQRAIFLEDAQGPVLWTLSPAAPREWSPTPIALGGPWIDTRWSYDPVGARVFLPDLSYNSTPCCPNQGFTDMAVLRLGPNPRLEHVPLRGPAADGREGAMSVYDSRRQRVLVFGGHDHNGPDTLSWRMDALDVSGDSATWGGFDVGAPALPVESGEAIYDSSSDRVIVVGGQAAGGQYRQSVYTLDLGAPSGWQAWALAESLNSALANYTGQRLAIDPVRRRLLYVQHPPVILIDGANGPTAVASHAPRVALLDSTFVWQLALDAPSGWQPVTYSGPAPGFELAQFVYDPARNLLTAYGDVGRNDLHELVLDGASAWSGVHYSDYIPGVADEHAFMAAYHAGVIVIDSYDSAVWRVERGPHDTWHHVLSQGQVVTYGMEGATVVFDSTTACGYRFGGKRYDGVNGELWQFTLVGDDSVAWRQLTPAGDAPPARWGASAVLDPVRHRMILYGGFADRALGDTWELDLDPPVRWRRLPDRGAPPAPRFEASAVYDSRRDAILLYGGNVGDPANLRLTDETWALSFADGDVWVPVTALGQAPAPRYAHGAVYDPLRDRMIVLWGRSYSQGRFDCGELDLAGTPTWRGFDAAGMAPPARASFGVAYDADHDQALCMGGESPAIFTEVDFPPNLYLDFSADPVRSPPPLTGPPLSILGFAPNPTRDVVNVGFDLPTDATVRARIYSTAGRLVRDLGDRRYVAGRHLLLWDGKDAAGGVPASGVYFARLSILGREFTGKFVLVR